jgi:UrcA family protein
LIASLGLNAAAASTADEGSFVVDATGLNLQSADGVAALYSQLRLAAESVCGLHEANGYVPRRQARRCVDDTLEAVVAEVGGRLLKARRRADIRLVRRSQDRILVPTTASARP